MEPTKSTKRKRAPAAAKPAGEKKPRAKPVSLHPLSFDEAMRKLVGKAPKVQ